jgi:predicted MFS family arabinose efflux permease
MGGKVDTAWTAAERGTLPAAVFVMAIAGGLAAANAHYSQPLLPVIATSLSVSATGIGWLPAVTQLGLVAGLLTILPLSDMLERRRMVILMFALLAVAALANGLAPGFATLLPAAFALGIGCVVAQFMTPFAALLAPAGREGEASSLVLSGVLGGVLLSRLGAGAIETVAGWRTVYLGSAVVMAATAVLLARLLPKSVPAEPVRYGALLRSSLAIARSNPRLRRHALNGALGFAAVMAFWATYAHHLAVQWHMGAGIAGLFGLVGVAGALAAARAGRFVDRGGFRSACLASAALMVAGCAAVWIGTTSLVALLFGVLLIDAAAGLGHAANQSSAFRLDPRIRGRINSVYMTAYFLGGSAGTLAGTALYAAAGWPGVAGFGLAAGAAIGIAELARPIGDMR